ncbi:LADA_0E08526g1_1 [Lachancea dasiensis]|uniref:LADA_0E08526g1_1 n=1 Tax=Lachancea dasiensis TaxID=1072105 RepID=A0A1G4JDC8_9SACH|nr:LADA_0E08526g1_1 [Lachancea dasiensis]
MQKSLGKRSLDVNGDLELPGKRSHSSNYRTFGKFPSKKPVLPIFERSGLLELESHNVKGVQLQHIEPYDRMSPATFYQKHVIPLHKQTHFRAMVCHDEDDSYHKTYDLFDRSSYLIGRRLSSEEENPEDLEEEKEVVLADIPIPEETCSKQHCVIQFRHRNGQLKAFVIDLDSSNGTLLNDNTLPRARYVELKSEDVLRFSTAESDSAYFLVFVAA